MANTPGLKLPLIIILLSAALFAGGLLLFLGDREEPVPVTPAATPERIQAPAVSPTPARFTDITREAGIDFIHVNGAYGDRLLPETMGAGVAFFDADNDGVVTVRMKGACGNCPMSMMTLKQGIERRMKAEIPEVESVESL